MTNKTDLLPPAGATHTIKPEHSKSPLWNVIKALGGKCFYYNGTQWMDTLDESYLRYYLQCYDAVTHEEIPTETPEEAEAFNKMKPYEFDEHISGAEHKKPITRYVSVPATVEGGNGDNISYTTKEIAQSMQAKPVFTQEMADAGNDLEIGMLYIDYEGDECEFIGENNPKCLVIGRLTKVRTHHKHLSVSDYGDIKPIDTRTPKQKAVDQMFEDAEVQGSKGAFEKLYNKGYRPPVGVWC
jgi:hypothetical protein